MGQIKDIQFLTAQEAAKFLSIGRDLLEELREENALQFVKRLFKIPEIR